MHKLFTRPAILLALAAAVSFTSCDKDDSDATAVASEGLSGVWAVTQSNDAQYNQSTYFLFRRDGSGQSQVMDKTCNTFTYSISENSKEESGVETGHIAIAYTAGAALNGTYTITADRTNAILVYTRSTEENSPTYTVNLKHTLNDYWENEDKD